MKMTRTLVAALVCTTMMAAPAFAAGTTTSIAPEAMATEAPAPANFDPAAKAAADRQAVGIEAITIDANPIIVLDPGHGGTDPGGTGNGLQEKNLTLDIANRAKSYMTTNYPATIYQTRTSDATTSLDARTTYANNKGANFFVSMHINAFSDATANGLETFYYPGSTNGQNLATDIYNKLKASYSTLRGVKSADFYVLHYTNMPASLGETGFITNAADASKLNTTSFRQTLAQQYAAGMHVYWWGY